MIKKEDSYEDIINLSHHVSEKHPRMSMYNRAAQFSPFAALTGFEEAVKETEEKAVKDSEEETQKYIDNELLLTERRGKV